MNAADFTRFFAAMRRPDPVRDALRSRDAGVFATVRATTRLVVRDRVRAVRLYQLTACGARNVRVSALVGSAL